MQSRPELSVEFRTLLLIILLFLAGGGIPFDSLTEAANSPYQGGTYLFLSLLYDLWQNEKTLQVILNHTAHISSLLTFFSEPANFDDSYWWLQHREELLKLSEEEQTFVYVAENPWLFRSIRNLIETDPDAYEKGISNRTLFHSVLQLAADYPEVRVPLSSGFTLAFLIENPELIPVIRKLLDHTQIKQILIENPTLIPFFLNNPTITLPTSGDWIMILKPANQTEVSGQFDTIALFRSANAISNTNVSLVLGNGTIAASWNGMHRRTNSTSVYLLIVRVDPTELSAGEYSLKVEVTVRISFRLTTRITAAITVHLIETPPEEPTP